MLTVISYPLYIAPAYRPVVFDVRSSISMTAHPELQIKGTLYIKRGGIFEAVATKYESPYNGGYLFRFNFAAQLQAYLTYDIYDDTTLAIISPNGNSIRSYYVTFQEFYNNPQGTMQGYWIGRTSDHYATNATLQHTQTQSLNPWTIMQTSNDPIQTFTQVITGPVITPGEQPTAERPPLINGHVISDHGTMVSKQAIMEFQGEGVSIDIGTPGKTKIIIPGPYATAQYLHPAKGVAISASGTTIVLPAEVTEPYEVLVIKCVDASDEMTNVEVAIPASKMTTTQFEAHPSADALLSYAILTF